MKALSLALIAGLFGGAFRLSQHLDGLPASWDRKEALSVWSSGNLKRFFVGYETALADIYWLRAIQYHGREISFNPESKLELLETYLNITTDLDPRFVTAYRYGAIFLSEQRFGAADPNAGIRLLEKGMRALPGNWVLAQDRAMITAFFQSDYALAAKRAEEAAAIPGAPANLKVMAAAFLAGEDKAAARQFWRRLTEPSEESFVRAAAQRYLDRLDAVDLAESLTKDLVPRYERIAGAAPTKMEDFLALGLLRAVPSDPTGVALSFDPREQRFRLTRGSSLFLEGL